MATIQNKLGELIMLLLYGIHPNWDKVSEWLIPAIRMLMDYLNLSRNVIIRFTSFPGVSLIWD